MHTGRQQNKKNRESKKEREREREREKRGKVKKQLNCCVLSVNTFSFSFFFLLSYTYLFAYLPLPVLFPFFSVLSMLLMLLLQVVRGCVVALTLTLKHSAKCVRFASKQGCVSVCVCVPYVWSVCWAATGQHLFSPFFCFHTLSLSLSLSVNLTIVSGKIRGSSRLELWCVWVCVMAKKMRECQSPVVQCCCCTTALSYKITTTATSKAV